MTKQEYQREYYKKNKENRQKLYQEKKEYYKEYYQQNKDKIIQYSKKRNEENKDDVAKKYQDTKDGGYVVYMLKDNYVGVTQHTYDRLKQHRSKRGYTGKYVCVLHQTNCAKDASELEELLHDIGYKGRHKQNMPYA
tara:strand:- start:305 stop:715 length:411 start_codon:yes stop_codon:yes gene_type:complete